MPFERSLVPSLRHLSVALVTVALKGRRGGKTFPPEVVKVVQFGSGDESLAWIYHD